MTLEPEFKTLAEKITGRPRRGSIEIILTVEHEGLTRFANNVVSQHIEQQSRELSIRVLRNHRQGTASCNQWDDAMLDQTVRRAEELAALQPEDPMLLPLLGPQFFEPLPRLSRPLLALRPEQKVGAIRKVVSSYLKEDLSGAGIFSHGRHAVGLANSEGLWAFHEGTSSTFSTTAIGENSSGWAEQSHWDIHKIQPPTVGRRAAEKALASRHPKSIRSGAYTVILEPAAVAELMLFMAWNGFGALAYQEGRSFLSGKMGRRLIDERLTILDDVTHPDSTGLPFDFEGTARQRVVLIRNGLAEAVVYDRRTAEHDHRASTGHALPQPNTSGPLPMNLVMEPGDSTLAEMISSTNRGLLVTRFHYTNLLDPIPLSITGMTRDGTFWIQDGKIRHGVKNLRFTQSVVEAFNRIESIGREAVLTHPFWGIGIVCPALKIRDFKFSSETMF